MNGRWQARERRQLSLISVAAPATLAGVNSNFANSHFLSLVPRRFPSFAVATALAVVIPGLAGCRHAAPDVCQKPAAAALTSTNRPASTVNTTSDKAVAKAKRYT